MREESGFDQVFGIGFKIGFLIIIVGLILFFAPYLDVTLNLALDFMGFWDNFTILPPWLQLIFGGIIFVGVAVIIGCLKELLEGLVRLIFFKDDEDF